MPLANSSLPAITEHNFTDQIVCLINQCRQTAITEDKDKQIETAISYCSDIIAHRQDIMFRCANTGMGRAVGQALGMLSAYLINEYLKPVVVSTSMLGEAVTEAEKMMWLQASLYASGNAGERVERWMSSDNGNSPTEVNNILNETYHACSEMMKSNKESKSDHADEDVGEALLVLKVLRIQAQRLRVVADAMAERPGKANVFTHGSQLLRWVSSDMVPTFIRMVAPVVAAGYCYLHTRTDYKEVARAEKLIAKPKAP